MNLVMTKQKEREILEQICDLIKSTGADSYISMAFRGVPEYALRNIEEDAAYNPVDELSAEHARNLRKDAEYGEKLLKVEHERDVALEKLRNAEEERDTCKRVAHEYSIAIADKNGKLDGLVDRCEKQQAQIRVYQSEITRLKAKLYDFIMKGENDNV